MSDAEIAQATPLPLGTGDAQWHSTELASPYASGMESPHPMDGPKEPRSITVEVNVEQRRQVGRPIIHTGNTEDPGLTSAERRKIRHRSANRESARRTQERHQEPSDQMTSQVTSLKEVNTRLLSEIEQLRTGMIQLQRERKMISLDRSSTKQQPEVATLLEDSNTIHTKVQRPQHRATTRALLQEHSLHHDRNSSGSTRSPDRTANPVYGARAQPWDVGSASIHGHAQQTADTTEVWVENESVAGAICKDMLMCGGSKLIIRGEDAVGYKIERVQVEEQRDVWHPIPYIGSHQENIRASTLPQKPRYVWSPEAHSQFEQVVAELGKKAVPSIILESLPGFGLTREHVASHLQKHRTRAKLLVSEETCGQLDMDVRDSSRATDYSDTLQDLSKAELCDMLTRIRSTTQPRGDRPMASSDFHQKVDDFDMSLGMVIASEPMFSRPLPGSSLHHMLPFEGHDDAGSWDAMYSSPQGLLEPETATLNSHNSTGSKNGNANVAETGG